MSNDILHAALIQAAATILAEQRNAAIKIAAMSEDYAHAEDIAESLNLADKVAIDFKEVLHGLEAGYAGYLSERKHLQFPSPLED